MNYIAGYRFEKTHKLTGSSSYVRCNKCHTVLTQFCAKCSANPDDTFLQHLTNKIENANGSAQAVFRSEDTRKRSQNDGGNNVSEPVHVWADCQRYRFWLSELTFVYFCADIYYYLFIRDKLLTDQIHCIMLKS